MVVKENQKNLSETLKDLAQELHEAVSDQLISLVLYGQSTKDVNSKNGRDIQLTVVLKSVTADVLDKIGSPLSKAWQQFNVQPYVVTKEELVRLADVFPLKIWSMQKHGQTLHGENVVDAISIEREHLRLRIEQQLRNIQIRIRRRLLSTGQDARLLIPVIFQLSANIHTPLEVMLHLKDKSLEGLTQDELFAKATEIFGLDASTFEHFKRPHMCSPGEIEKLGEEAVQLLSKLVDIADTLEV
ncbi:MAG: hypothetical protein P1V97_00460 [Planctomycetota bacterium]|nr:hypothetical protein [Planctomycetota bacterium]